MRNEKKSININFILYLLGRMVSDTGTSMQMVVMPLYIIDAGGKGAAVGIFSFASLIPALLIFPFAGVLGDRMNRKTIMVASDFASAAVILGMAVASHWGMMSLPLLLGGIIVISLLNGLFDPATRGMLPQLVAHDKLTSANSKVSSLRGLSVLLGPVIGTALYARFGITVLFLINGISFLLSAISEMLIRYKHTKIEAPQGAAGIIKDLSEGFGFIRDNSMIRRVCFFFLAMYAIMQPIFAVALPLFYKTQLGYSDVQYGYLQSFTILGMLLGSALVGLIFSKESNFLRPLKLGSGLLMGCMFLFSFMMFPEVLALFGNNSIRYFIMLAGILCLFSAANMFIYIPIQSFIQKETPNKYMSRVFSIVGMITRGGMPFGGLIYGFVLSIFSIHWTILVAALMMLLITINFFASMLKGIEG